MAKVKKFKSEFAQVPNSLLQDPKLSFKARGIWAYMQSLPEDWDFSVERIAGSGQDGKASVRSGLQELEAAGYLVRTVVSIGSGGSEADYQLTVPASENRTVETVAPSENRPAGNRTLDIVITNKQIPTNINTGTSPSASATEQIFEAFWQSYPNKKGKGQAAKAFRSAIARSDRESFLAGYKAFLRISAGKDKKYIPHPATWLNGDRWLDEYEEPTTQNFGL